MAQQVREYHEGDPAAMEARCGCGWTGKLSEVEPVNGLDLNEFYNPMIPFPAGACPTACGGTAYWIPGTGQSDCERMAKVIELLSDTVHILKLVGCPKTVAKVRLALSSAKGAVRNVNYRRLEKHR